MKVAVELDVESVVLVTSNDGGYMSGRCTACGASGFLNGRVGCVVEDDKGSNVLVHDDSCAVAAAIRASRGRGHPAPVPTPAQLLSRRWVETSTLPVGEYETLYRWGFESSPDVSYAPDQRLDLTLMRRKPCGRMFAVLGEKEEQVWRVTDQLEEDRGLG